MMRQFLSTYLSGSGAVHAFSSGLEAIENLRLDNWPDVIILDLNLPDISGLEFINHLKQKDLLNRLKVIVLSADDKATTRIECLAAGASDYLIKPFHPRELQLRILKIAGVAEVSKVA
jgi:DNA-binding response OmpR family regulator